MSTAPWTASHIRQTFLDFFESKAHKIVSSAPLVLKDDPTLMFTNAGMNQFKDIFLNYKPATAKRVADTQKCLRVSGKHNDLEEVGLDTYHHTMFEMLGNWSFGDYFKKESIAWAWELLTEVYGIPKDRLYVTIFEGDETEDLARDIEAYDFWKALIAEDRIINGNKKDNFWEMGETGPCGPCSEIHVDIRPDVDRAATDGKALVNQDHPQVVEIWNLVFMQFNRKADGRLESLAEQHIDTGMGFERLAMVLQGVQSNYDTDVFTPLIDKVKSLSGKPYSGSMEKSDIAMRVIADHIRAIAFAIADGQLPSNTGAGYVIRRILRRAVRYGYSFLDLKQPFLFELIPVLQAQFKTVFPEIESQGSIISKVIQEEENSFLRTLESGLKRLESLSGNITGEQAFELYDTYGFPIDLTRLIADEKGVDVDNAGFEAALKAQKERSRAAGKMETGDWTEIVSNATSSFVGYDTLEAEVQVVKHRTVKQKNKEIHQIVFDKTPFYAESGGQVGDKGTLEIGGKSIPIYDTKKENDLIIHFIKEIPADLSGKGVARVDATKRLRTMGNHSATHLLHAALRDVLGTHVQQKGSLVNPEKLRFDFSHFSKMSDEEIARVEAIVNEKVLANIPKGEDRSVPFDEAVARGAMALFGEKYGDEVRVITFDPEFSVELCGGTHVEATGEIGLVKIVSESAIAAGVRRIEAISGAAAKAYYDGQAALVQEIAEVVNNTKDPLAAAKKLVEENTALKAQLDQLVAQQASQIKQTLKAGVEEIDGVNFIGAKIDLSDSDAIKNLAFQLKQEVSHLFLVLGAEVKGKAQLTVMMSDELVAEKGWNAGQLIRELAKSIKGGGGGQPFYATAGGSDATGIPNAIEQAKATLVG
ncbi:MAG: alanine--tRNA ligase [Saprospiraceae bacterium]|nr:alanine--tRNA ligase [Saprospiraceae bacterium]